MTFDLCVPAHNEAEIIQESLERIAKALEESEISEWRIVVSDSASTDNTHEIVQSLQHPKIHTVRLEEKGKGRAIVEASRYSESHHFGFIDADLSADPSELVVLLAILLTDQADIVIGSRLLNTDIVKRGAMRSASSYAFNGFRRTILGIKVADSQCGLKVMNAKAREILRSCVETGWFLDIEFLAKAERANLRIVEVPVHWNENTFEGRQSKLRVLRDGIGAIAAMIRIRQSLKDT
jgi:glycosyltransferase involved in cell wall biosynthesis